ncbi:MAG: DUF2141 domain-containing protein [Alphaproteobacteria bacterium]
MTVERLAVAVLLCAGLDVTGAGAREQGEPLAVAVPLSSQTASPEKGAAKSAQSGKAAAAEMPAEEGAGPAPPGDEPEEEEEFVPLVLPAEDSEDGAGADTGGDSSEEEEQASVVEPAVLGLDEEPPGPTFFVHAEILGVPDGKGMIAASLCKRKNFTKSGCRTERVPAREGQVSVTFGNVKPGKYAVQVHHDQNGNGKMDFSFFGLPKEPYGFSRDAKPVLAPPKFESAYFEVTDGDVSLVINLQNT